PLSSQQIAVPDTITRYKLTEWNMFDYMPNWVRPLVGSPAERAARLRDPEVRAAMQRDVEAWPNLRTDWSLTRVGTVAHARNDRFEGLTVRELAAATGKASLDAYLDLALDEDLETEFEMPLIAATEETLKARGESFKNPYAHISISDGGAHTRFLTLSTWPIWWLSHWVRDRELMSL